MTDASEPGGALGALVLAAGESRRFGGAKLLAEIGGEPMLDRVIDAVRRPGAVDRIVVVLGARAEQVSAGARLDGVEIVHCEQWREGIAASLRAGVEALADCDAILVVLGDEPLLRPEAITAIVDHAGVSAPAVRALRGGQPAHPVLIKRELFDAVRGLHGDQGARDLLAARGVHEVELDAVSVGSDVNTRADLGAARRDAKEAN